MVARVGDDLFGTAYIDNFKAQGIDTSHVHGDRRAYRAGVAPIFVDSAGQNRILVVKGANDRLVPADVDAAGDLLRRADFIVLQLEIPLETVYYALRFARANGIRTILNPAPGQPLDLARAGACRLRDSQRDGSGGAERPAGALIWRTPGPAPGACWRAGCGA